MPDTTKELLDTLKAYSYWQREGSGFLCVYDDGTPCEPRLFFEDAAFDALAPGLSALVAELHVSANVMGDTIMCVLDYWAGKYVVLPTEALVQGHPHDRHVRSFYRTERVGDDIWLDCSCYDVAVSQEGKTYAESTSVISMLKVDGSWLDANYPAWKTRYDIAVGLGLDQHLVGRLLFDVDQVPGHDTTSVHCPENLLV